MYCKGRVIYGMLLLVTTTSRQHSLSLSLLSVSGFFTTDMAAVHGIAVDAAGYIYVADRNCSSVGGGQCGMVYRPNGTVAGLIRPSSPAAARLTDTHGVALDSTGRAYFSDSAAKRVVLYLKSATTGQYNYQGQYGNSSNLGYPWGVAVLGNTTVYVSDNTQKYVAKFDLSRKYLGSIGAGTLKSASGIAVDATRVYVADTTANIIKVFALNGGGLVGTWGSSVLKGPYGVAVGNGAVFVADTGNNRVVKLSSSGSQLAVITGFNKPHAVAVGTLAGERGCSYIVVADTLNNRVALVYGV